MDVLSHCSAEIAILSVLSSFFPITFTFLFVYFNFWIYRLHPLYIWMFSHDSTLWIIFIVMLLFVYFNICINRVQGSQFFFLLSKSEPIECWAMTPPTGSFSLFTAWLFSFLYASRRFLFCSALCWSVIILSQYSSCRFLFLSSLCSSVIILSRFSSYLFLFFSSFWLSVQR